jgi:hypothetical protein
MRLKHFNINDNSNPPTETSEWNQSKANFIDQFTKNNKNFRDTREMREGWDLRAIPSPLPSQSSSSLSLSRASMSPKNFTEFYFALFRAHRKRKASN